MRIGLIFTTVAGEYVATCPDLPEFAAEGRSLSELQARARDGLLSALEMRDHREVHRPSRFHGAVELAALGAEAGPSFAGLLFLDVEA
jgi:predicted RNase H-like HicB family nuclease